MADRLVWLLPALITVEASAHAANAAAQAQAVIVEPASVVGTALSAPVSVQDLLQLILDAPAGPATGALVPRINSPAAPGGARLVPLRLAGALDSRQAFGVDLVAGADAARLSAGLAAAVTAMPADASAPDQDGGPPLVITVAFN